MRCLAFFPLLVACATAQAGEFSGALDQIRYRVEDPAGAVPGDGAALAWHFGWEEKWGFDRRWYGGVVGMTPMGIVGSETTVGQSVSGWGLEVGARWRLRLARHFQPAMALALRWQQRRFTSRHLTDADGYLAARLPERENASVELVAGIRQQLFRSGPWGVLLGLETALPTSTGWWWAIGAGVTYRWEGF